MTAWGARRGGGAYLVLRPCVWAPVGAEPGVEGGRVRPARHRPAGGCRCLAGRCPCDRTGGWVMGSGVKMGELKRAAQQLGVTGTTLREHGWKTASAERVQAVKDNP